MNIEVLGEVRADDKEAVKANSIVMLEKVLESVKSGEVTEVLIFGTRQEEAEHDYAVACGMTAYNQAKILQSYQYKLIKQSLKQILSEDDD